MAGYTNTVPPTVTGTRTVGGTVSANPGTWSPTPPAFSYAWHRADDQIGTNEQVIFGATGSTYTLGPFDVAKFLRVGVYPIENVFGGDFAYGTGAYGEAAYGA